MVIGRGAIGGKGIGAGGRPDQLHAPCGDRGDILAVEVAAIDDDLGRHAAHSLLDAGQPGQELLIIAPRLRDVNGHDELVRRIGGELHIVARRDPAVGLLHHPRVGIGRAHPLHRALRGFELREGLEGLLQSLHFLSLGPLPRRLLLPVPLILW